MCRNITTLRGLEPGPTAEEIEAAARQYVRKVSGVQKTSAATEEPFERAVAEIAHITAHLLAGDQLVRPARRARLSSLPRALRCRASTTTTRRGHL